MTVAIEHLYLVYDADAGVRGEVAYVFGKLRGRHCGLCDITHGTLREKPAFRDLACSLAVPVDVWHRNEQTPDVAAFTRGITPAWWAGRPAGWNCCWTPTRSGPSTATSTGSPPPSPGCWWTERARGGGAPIPHRV